MPPKAAAAAVKIPRRRTKVDPAHPVYELDIWMAYTEPPIYRSVVVPAEFTLGDLHDALQVLFDWEQCHLHHFVTKDRRFFEVPHDEDFDLGFGPEKFDEDEFTLRDMVEELKQGLEYEYDFGDGWIHLMKIIRSHPDATGFSQMPMCVEGALAAPPEDCGGIPGYYNLVDALNDKKHPDHEYLKEWFGGELDAEVFDSKEINRELARCFAKRK